MQALLQEGMRELLRTAGNTSAAEPWPCVHALNVLCQAFNDRHLALDISGFCAEGECHCQGCKIDLSRPNTVNVVTSDCHVRRLSASGRFGTCLPSL